ncbi:MAG TPA: putative glycoside hydrolase, partial [Planctomycetaceae bacterium]
IGGRTFPSVFQAWAPADNLPGEDRLTTLTRHDLVWNVPQFFGLKWDRFPVGLAEGFTPHGIAEGQVLREQLLAKNPRMVLLAEIRYRDAPQDYLPDGHEWWLRDGSGQPVSGWKEGGHLRLDLRSPGFRRHVAAQCRAAVASGVVDGVMLDWWDDDEHRLALVKEVRRAVGEEALIIANANARMTPRTAPYLNGYFMECTRSRTPEDWKRIAATLTWAETHLREQRVNCVETWWHGSRRDESLMRATTALALTHSDGYCLFSDPNPLPASDHLHDWYPFWDANLGRPLGRGEKQPDGTVRRRFENGFAVYNPMGNGKKATVRFDRPHRSVATGETDDKHSLPSGDGDIYLPGAYSGGH